MAATQTAFITNQTNRWSPENLARFRAAKRTRAPKVAPLRGLELGRLFIEKRDEMRGQGTRGKFTEWFREQGYTQAFVSKWIRRARENWLPQPKKLRSDKGSGKLAANNGAAYRRTTPQVNGFMPARTGKDLSEFDVHGATFSPISMDVPTGLSESDWMAIGRNLATAQNASLFWVGDWVDAGAAQFGKRVAYDLAQAATGMGRGSLYTIHVVSRAINPARRVPELTFKHSRNCCHTTPDDWPARRPAARCRAVGAIAQAVAR